MRLAMALIIMLFVSPAWAVSEFYNIDRNHTFPHFAIDHMGIATMWGRFDQTRGRIIMDRENNNGYVEVVISAVSINTGLEKRDQHLRSPDFLNVMEYPDIKYESRNVVFDGPYKATVEGDLTLLGITKPVALQVNRIRCGKNPITKEDVCGFEATADIKRSDFGNTFAYPTVGDNIELWFQVEAIKEVR